MLRAAGLSLEQAPPVHLPFRFFLTGPLFGVAAGMLLVWQGEAVLASRWTPAALAVTHLIAIGFVSQIMCGALLQMLPVIVGSPLPAVRLVGTVVHVLLSLGAALMAWGFAGGGSPLLFLVGAGCAATGLTAFLVPLGLALGRARGAPDTVRAMRLSAVALAVTLLFGLLLTAALQGWLHLESLTRWVDIHMTWGMLGWVGLLVLGVAYQVVPMFHVTPPYPRWLARLLAPGLIFLFVAGSLLLWAERDGAVQAVLAVVAAGFTLFAVVTVRLQLHRGRPRLDATLMHWWLAMASMVAAAATWLFQGSPELIGVFLLVGVGIGLPSGMLFKIMPFLSWFHLQYRQIASGRLDLPVPHMHSFLSERDARLHFSAHLVAVVLLVASFVEPQLARSGGVALALSALLLEGLIIKAAWLHRRLECQFTSESSQTR